jgi:hypothetical protein
MNPAKLYRQRALAYPLPGATGTVHTRHIRTESRPGHTWAVGLVVIAGDDAPPRWRAMVSLTIPPKRFGATVVPEPRSRWSAVAKLEARRLLVAALIGCGDAADHPTSRAGATHLELTKPLSIAEAQAVGESLARLSETSMKGGAR